jgi:tRNA-binding EMAP/Myf-like protein
MLSRSISRFLAAVAYSEPFQPMASWTCPACDFDGNEPSDLACVNCEEPRPAAASPSAAGDAPSAFDHYAVGLIVACDDIAGKDKLKKCVVDIGAAEPVHVVTNAPNAKPGLRVVVALPGAVVGDVVVKRTQIGGVPSNGMLCDSPMLGWSGGGAGTAATLPDSVPLGSKPPACRPRGN